MEEECDGTAEALHYRWDGSWWEYDAQAKPLVRVCDKCRDAKLGHTEAKGGPVGEDADWLAHKFLD